MFPRAMSWAFLLMALLWTEWTEAGSSFLSPADLEKPVSKKPSRKVIPTQQQRREAGGLWGNYEQPMEGDNEERDIQFNFPFELDVKIPITHYHEYRQSVQNVLEGLFAGHPQEVHQENE
ncbi:appetite-regulating hormone [Rhinatrema bivittatum]|uniref:appetite-regulating hormone n=1 Tax=Rhinatrema bivittatum TaxID=194408 RepID=UPI00112D6AE8|nr:appetite-regulating hormone [Rhinatrema bivittatum]